MGLIGDGTTSALVGLDGRVVPAEHPRMVATTSAVADPLSAGGGLLYRQAFSHIGVIAAGVTLARTLDESRATGTGRMSHLT